MRFLTYLWPLLLAMGPMTGPARSQNERQQQGKQVVILYTHRPMARICDDWDRGIRGAVLGGFDGPIDIEIEYLNLTRFNDPDYRRCWIELLKTKYASNPPDLIIPVYVPALQFLLEQRAAIFADIPIVFCSASPPIANRAHSLPGVTGVAFRLDLKGTLSLARQLHPANDRLIVLSGDSEQENSSVSAVRQEILSADTGMEIEFVTGLPLPELIAKLQATEQNTSVLMLSYDQDSAGKKYMTVEALEQIAETCPLPVYGLYSTLLGHGIVGGRLVSAESQGRLAGELAIRVLNGERPEEIAIVGLDGGTDMFDARQLARWNFDEADLPPESIVVYREPTAWEQFGNYFLIGVAGFLLLISIIVSLLVNRTRRMKAEQEARDLAGKILTVQEDERRYLAREIHDDLSQRLAASAIVAGNLQQKLHQTPEVREELGRLGGNLITICDDMHRLSRQMSPAILDDFGLSDALRAECDRVADRDGIEAVFRSGDVPPEVPHDIELGLYRIAQEALWNTSKHAKADRVAVDLLADPEFICLEIRDDGCGFDPGLVTAKQGLGLASMRERARLLGGTIVIDAAPGAGVQISVRIPLSEPCA